MMKRHEDDLNKRFDELAWEGIAFVHFWELKTWYGQERLTKTVWQDLINRFEQATHEDDKKYYPELYTYDIEGGIWLIHSDGLEKMSKRLG